MQQKEVFLFEDLTKEMVSVCFKTIPFIESAVKKMIDKSEFKDLIYLETLMDDKLLNRDLEKKYQFHPKKNRWEFFDDIWISILAKRYGSSVLASKQNLL